MSSVAQDAWEELCANDALEKNRSKENVRGSTVQSSDDKLLQAILSGKLDGKKKKKNKNKKKAKSSPPKGSEVEDAPVTSSSSPPKVPPETTGQEDICLPEHALTDPEMILRIIKRDVNLISSEKVDERRRSLERLDKLLFSDGATMESECLGTIFLELQKPLLKRLADPVEKCREIAILMLTKFISSCQDLGHLLPYFFPALMDRNSEQFTLDFENNEMVRDWELHEAKQRGKAVPLPDGGTAYAHQVSEPSEEIRLLLCEMLGSLASSLIDRNLHAMLGPYFHDMVMFFHACAVDPYPTLRILGLNWLKRIASEDRFANTMHHYCTALVRSIMPALRHRQSKVRITTIQCVGALVACPFRNKCRGGGTDAINDLVGFREDNVIPLCAFYQGETRMNYFGHLVTDANPSVRIAFYQVVSSWMTTLLDRWDHAARLLPFLLSSLSDESEKAQNLGLETLDELGKQYEEEHHDETIEKRQYGVDGAENTANYDLPLPPPWKYRPKLGTRLYVRQHTRRFLSTVLRELGDWRSVTKSSAVGLLRTTLVYLEEHATMELHLLVQTLTFLIQDEVISDKIEECAALAGRYVDPEAYVPLLLPHVEGEMGTISSVADSQWNARARSLRVLTCMFEGSRINRVVPHFTSVVKAITGLELVRASRDHSQLRQFHVLMLKYIVKICDSRAAVDAHFIKTGRLNSLQAQFDALKVLSVQLEDVESYNVLSNDGSSSIFELMIPFNSNMRFDMLVTLLKFEAEKREEIYFGLAKMIKEVPSMFDKIIVVIVEEEELLLTEREAVESLLQKQMEDDEDGAFKGKSSEVLKAYLRLLELYNADEEEIMIENLRQILKKCKV